MKTNELEEACQVLRSIHIDTMTTEEIESL